MIYKLNKTINKKEKGLRIHITILITFLKIDNFNL